MQRLRLDFLNPAGAPLPLGMILLTLGVLSAGIGAWQFQRLNTEQAALTAQIDDTQRLMRRELPRVHGSDAQLADEMARANVVLAALNMPWDALFSELESVANENVALLAIQPEAEGKRVRLSGEARRFEDVLAYVGRLEQTPGFARVFLLTHALREEGGVNFTIGADWTGRR